VISSLQIFRPKYKHLPLEPRSLNALFAISHNSSDSRQVQCSKANMALYSDTINVFLAFYPLPNTSRKPPLTVLILMEFMICDTHRDNSISTVTGLRARRPGSDSRQGQRNFIFATASPVSHVVKLG